MSLNKNPLVSIIMPVFNAKEFLGDAISSVLEQSYKNIELLIVDDGSSDGSKEVCDLYAEKDSRVRVIHQVNHGLCYARNKGLDMAGGGYISFADHDDLYLIGSIKNLVRIAVEEPVDLIKGTYVGEIQNIDGSIRKYEANMPTAILSIQELANQYTAFNYSIRAMWNGMYKADIINRNNIRFDETLKAGAEDYAFNLAYLRHIKRIGLTEYPLYKHYARANQSASIGYNENRQNGIIKDYHAEVDLLKNLDISPKTYICHQLWYFYMLVREYCFEDTPINNKEIMSRLKIFLDEIEEFRKVSLRDKILLYKQMPKTMIKWELLHWKKVGLLFSYYKLKDS